MEEQHNRRSTDEQFFKLVEQYKDLKREVEILRHDFEEHKDLDEKTHAKMLAEMDALKMKIDNVLQVLMTHVTVEETKFDVQAIKIDDISRNIEKLTVDTAPAVAATKWAQYTGVVVKFVKDTIAPLIVGAGAVGRWLNDKVKEVISVKDFGAVGDGATQFTINTNVTPTTNCTIGYMIDCEL